METAAGLVKLKSDAKQTVYNWRKTLQERREEVIATLRDEGVKIESYFEVKIADEDYLLWYMRAESVEKAWEIALKSQHDIDAFHFQVFEDITAPGGKIFATPILDLYDDQCD
ncbi:MAG: DUF6176 family protein [Phormidesmis sp.]